MTESIPLQDTGEILRPSVRDAFVAGVLILLAYIVPTIPVGLWAAPRILAAGGRIPPALMAEMTRQALAWQMLTYPLVFATIWWFVRRNGGPKFFGLHTPTVKQLGYAMLAVVAMILVVDGTAAAMSAVGIKMGGDAKTLLPDGSSSGYMTLVLIMGAILAPLAEEGAFRIIALRTMIPRMPLWLALAISSLMFAAAHLSVTTLLPLALGGVVLGLLYTKSRNGWLSIITHGTFNAVAIISTIANVGPR